MNYNSVELIYSTERLLFSLFFHFAHLYSAWLQQYACVPSLENIFPGDNTHRFHCNGEQECKGEGGEAIILQVHVYMGSREHKVCVASVQSLVHACTHALTHVHDKAKRCETRWL